MKQGRFILAGKENLDAAGKLWRLRFQAPDIEACPGQFVNIEIDSHYLRRPISVSEYSDGILSLIVQTVGDGTQRLVSAPVGHEFDMLTGLGNRFSLPAEAEGRDVLVVGGGVGFAPLVGWMRHLAAEGKTRPRAVFGFNSRCDVPLTLIDEMKSDGIHVDYCTLDGSTPLRGNAIEVMQRLIREEALQPAYFYTCGPMPMMKAAAAQFDFEGQLSLEARMGCGFGACMGCSVKTTLGPKRICKEGPVFEKSELL